MKIDTFTEKLMEITSNSSLSDSQKVTSVCYWLMLFNKQREEYLKSKNSSEPEALGTGTI